MGDKKAPPPKKIPGYMNFIFGGTSGMLATSVVQPADLLKTRMQLLGPAGKNMSTITVAKDIIKKEGPLGLYTGISAALFRQATYTTGRLGVFNVLSDNYKSFPVKIGIGVIAGAFGAFVGTPAEVTLIRMTADGRLPPEKKRNYKHVFNALASFPVKIGIGVIAGAFGAFVGTPAEVTLIRMTADGRLPPEKKRNYKHVFNALASMGDGLPLHFTASMISGLITSVASLPVDIVKTRVQNAAKGTGQLTVLMGVIKNEGVLALWNGFIPTYFKIGPHTVLTFIFLEQLNTLYLSL
ncbi:putative Mitochondrial 2-oxoglutarate/malate carrier protein [Operophtera brumata]|uniref:Putative Mitochondrial 2-oxoglutarate/malate carrier protein n=1 Tax=Operophtera brumata TaxID=104452 RepID=A0A0L7KTD4_OPEBR|nr:putative Mitochondrial 2-oxoglutarate/malate carrier protein [Operophtera brumata]